MKSTYTAGPWFFDSDDLLIRSELLNDYIAQALSHDSKGALIPDCESNARLIAAAPDLLWALEKMLREHDALQMAENKTDDRWPAATAARKAISKAIGA